MARDESSVSNLSFEKRTLLLNSKLAILNRDFVRFLCEEVTNDAEIDLTPSVTSYMDNVKDLRRMYNLGGKEKMEKDGEIIRKKITARRRLKEGDTTKGGDITLPFAPKIPQLKMSTPAGLSAPSQLEMSADISAISPFGGCNAALKKKDTDDDTLKVLPPTIGAPSAASGGRKRAIRGGGPLGDGESVVFRGAGEKTSTISTPTITVRPPPILFELPKPTSGFWNTKPSGGDKKEEKEEKKSEEKREEKKSEAPAIGGFSLFGSINEKMEEKKEEKGEEKKEESKPFAFGESAPKFTGFNFGGVASSSSSSSTTESSKPPPSTGGFNLFGSINNPSSTSTSSSTTPTLTFGLPKGGLVFPSSIPSTGGPSTTTEGGTEGDEEGEYVPPKAEVVENKEEDAKISLKCAVFKLEGKEYAKLGVGQLHVKENEGKSSLLVRAATATGTIWVNGRVDGTMTAEKATEDKIRVTLPVSSSEMKTFLIRIGTKEDAAKVLTTLKEAGAK
ncbi:hypothetical protein PENTCL1PPCAC_11608 [Pristionchus entomophagus]|uniref:RanBD1 domain-containing protein n=1 Tax=Pristionchus entomophagus TaxID=358040 RepID=A0AAV5T2A1_9BILA|nr:hypothetical protein PENTCL1PPCAC_11608 [Pristionchus entomophagus]